MYLLKKINSRPYITVPDTENTKEHDNDKEEDDKMGEQEMQSVEEFELKNVSCKEALSRFPSVDQQAIFELT